MTEQPTVGDYMSEHVSSVAPTAKVRTALDLMQARGVRHLPVIHTGQAVGVISLSDLYVLESTLGLDPDVEKVGEHMVKDVYVVQCTTPLAEAARHMADARIGSAIVMEEGRLCGLFTATDAVRALADCLESR